MISPTLWIERHVVIGTDVHGQPTFGTRTREQVAPVKLIFDSAKTTVRTDSSGTHGQAQEFTADVVLLLRPTSKIMVEDILTVAGHKVKVIAEHRRYSPTGTLDHIEIHCLAWK